MSDQVSATIAPPPAGGDRSAPRGGGPDRQWGARRRLLQPQALVIGVAAVIVAYLAIVPLGYLLWGTFVGPDGATLQGFREAFASGSDAPQMLFNTVAFAAGSAALALVIGTCLGWVVVRTDVPFRSLIFAASLVPLIIPGILYGIAWIFLADPSSGVINWLAAKVLGHGIINVYSIWGMIIAQGLHLSPIAFMFMAAAFRGMDPSLEEAAVMSGASPWSVGRKVTLPLLRPAVGAAVLLVFVQSLESFEIPAVIGMRGGVYVFTSRIYLALQTYPFDYLKAGALGVTLLIIAIALVLVTSWLTRSGSRFQTITGKGFRPTTISLGRARPWVGAGVALYFFIGVVMPTGILIWASLLKYYQVPTWDALKSVTLQNYHTALDMPLLRTAFQNSVVLGLGAATVVMALTTLISWMVVRTRVPGRKVLDVLAATPLVIPGLVMGLALLFVYLRLPVGVYGTLWILLLSYVTRYLPYGMRYASAALGQMNPELEESAMMSGATWWQAFRRVLMPLASSGIVAGWAYILIVSFRELSSTILIYSPGKETLSVLLWEEFSSGRFTIVAAIGVLMVLVLVLIVGFAYRFGVRFQSGSTD